ncbi:MAG: hypothetical protein KGK10_09025, partial [Rhodospirillales bacterium]|nr:hypothetical protein [Rhodospirillales bacterium]
RISILYALKHDTRRDQSCRIESLPHATDSLADQGTAHANFSKIESEPRFGADQGTSRAPFHTRHRSAGPIARIALSATASRRESLDWCDTSGRSASAKPLRALP